MNTRAKRASTNSPTATSGLSLDTAPAASPGIRLRTAPLHRVLLERSIHLHPIAIEHLLGIGYAPPVNADVACVHVDADIIQAKPGLRSAREGLPGGRTRRHLKDHFPRLIGQGEYHPNRDQGAVSHCSARIPKPRAV